MIGAIIGDIIGSVYEHDNIKTKDFPLFSNKCTFTDDTVLSVATAKWLLEGNECYRHYYELTSRYSTAGYGTGFIKWYFQVKYHKNPKPYNSCGNGSAMRVGPVGWAFDIEPELLAAAKISAECTHNHPEGIRGAQAIAFCIFMARHGFNVAEIKQAIEERFGYNLSTSIDELRLRYSWHGMDGLGNGGICQDSVPQAIICALQAFDFEDAIRNAISIGGDSDTIGCMTGSIAEALYGIPKSIAEKASLYLPDDLSLTITDFEKKFGTFIINN